MFVLTFDRAVHDPESSGSQALDEGDAGLPAAVGRVHGAVEPLTSLLQTEDGTNVQGKEPFFPFSTQKFDNSIIGYLG